MLSLEKLQVNDEENIPLEELEKWLSKGTGKKELSPKFDGNAMSLFYENGVLVHAVTRGDGEMGLDKTDKLKYLVPNYIADKGQVEIRGEVVISLKVYEEKYYDPNKVSNPRNFVAGLLNRDELDLDTLKDMVFVAYSYVRLEGDRTVYVNKAMQNLKDFGFNQDYDVFIRYFEKASDFPKLYQEFKKYREVGSPFLLDGMVLKFSEDQRAKIGQHSHHPNWALAIKFETLTAVTKILSIDWTVGTSGELSPIANLEPVELLGTIVKKASLYNLGSILKKKMFPGATVSIRKSGEIIPQVMQVLIPSPNQELYEQQYEKFKEELSL
jgi:DNA ligase (NAD+)